MNAFLSLPDWAPGWLGPLLVIFGALFALAFLLMPFTVFSLKARLDQIEMKIEDLHADLRAVAPPDPAILPRAPIPMPPAAWAQPPSAHVAPYAPMSPPIPPPAPPPAHDRYPAHPPAPLRAPPPRAEPPRDPYRDDPRPQRAEPKLNWPR